MYYTIDQVTYDSILDVLGGEDMLRLMIDAENFDYTERIGRRDCGLRFHFRSGEDLRKAEFVPIKGVRFEPTIGFDENYYTISLTIKTFNGGSFEMVKPWDCIRLTNPRNIVKTFETMAKVTVGF